MGPILGNDRPVTCGDTEQGRESPDHKKRFARLARITSVEHDATSDTCRADPPASHGHVWDTRETGPEAGGGHRLPTGRHPGIRIRLARLALSALLLSPLNRPGLVLKSKFLSVCCPSGTLFMAQWLQCVPEFESRPD